MVATLVKDGKVARIGVGGFFFWVIQAMPELKSFYGLNVFPLSLNNITIYTL